MSSCNKSDPQTHGLPDRRGNIFQWVFWLTLALALYPLEAGAVYCKAAGVPKGCVARPAAGAVQGVGAGARGVGVAPAVGVGSPDAGVSPAAGTLTRGGALNRPGFQ